MCLLSSPKLSLGTLQNKIEEPVAAANLDIRYNSVHDGTSNASSWCDAADLKVII